MICIALLYEIADTAGKYDICKLEHDATIMKILLSFLISNR